MPSPRSFLFPLLCLIASCTHLNLRETDDIVTPTVSFSFSGTIGSQGTGPGQYLNPACVTFDMRGLLFILDRETNRILVFNDSLFQYQFGGFGTESGRLDDPVSLAISPNYLYVFDTGARKIVRYNLAGDYLSSIDMENYLGRCAIDVDDYGYIYLCSNEANKIVKLSGTGEEILEFGSFGWGEGFLDSPHDIHVAQNGDIYIADAGNHRVEVFDTYGEFKKEIGLDVLKKPLALDLDRLGNLYVCDETSGAIFVFDASGALLYRIEEMLRKPIGISVGEGQFLVVDEEERKVLRFLITYIYEKN